MSFCSCKRVLILTEDGTFGYGWQFAILIPGRAAFYITKICFCHPRFLRRARGGDVLIIYSSSRDFQIRACADANSEGWPKWGNWGNIWIEAEGRGMLGITMVTGQSALEWAPIESKIKKKQGQGPGAVLDYSHIWMAKCPLLACWKLHTLKLLSLTACAELQRAPFSSTTLQKVCNLHHLSDNW